MSKCTYCPSDFGLNDNCNSQISCIDCVKKSIEDHDAKVRSDAIDEFVKAIEKHQTRQDSYLDPPYVEMGLDMTDILLVAEQLKEVPHDTQT